MDSSLNMENMPLASTAIRTCFWGREGSWLDRNRELSRSVHFPSLTLPSLLITSSKTIWISLVLSLLSNYFLEQELTWARFQILCLWMCVSSGRRKQKVICNLALEGEQLSREPGLFLLLLPRFQPMSVYCYCLVPLLMLNPFPHRKCERKPGKSYHSESSESIMDSSWDTARHLLDIWRRCPSCLEGYLSSQAPFSLEGYKTWRVEKWRESASDACLQEQVLGYIVCKGETGV